MAFGPLQHELLLYRYSGLQFSCCDGDSGSSRTDASPSRVAGGPSTQEPAAAAEAATEEESAALDGTRTRIQEQEDTLHTGVTQPHSGPIESAESAVEGEDDSVHGPSSSEELPPCAAQFDSHFQLLWRKRLVQHPKMLCKDSFLVRQLTHRPGLATCSSFAIE